MIAAALMRTRDLNARAAKYTWWLGYLTVMTGGLAIVTIARRRAATPFLGLSLGVLMVVLLGWLIKPRVTLYLTIFLTTISDIVTVSWFPFAKNLSSRESISYVADALTISPLEICLYVGVLVSVARRYASTRRLLPATTLTRPLVVFTGFVAFGFVRGLTSGGDIRIAVLAGRPLFFTLLVFIIMCNECTEDSHLRNALLAALAGVFVQALLSIQFLGRIGAAERDALESLNEHGSAIGQNLLFVTLLGLVFLAPGYRLAKIGLLVVALPVGYVYFVSQRRAAVAAIAIAGAMMLMTLFWRRRRTFWLVAPVVIIATVGYVGAFWNSGSSLGFPAQAIKSVVAPGAATAEDRQSDLYRDYETFDLNFTIRSSPVLGLGFGQPFYRPIPLPDIGFFELNAYQPHNSVLWIWIKTGFGGFAAMMYLFAKTLAAGAERIRRVRSPVDLVVAQSATLFVAMYAVYTYVDVSWDARNTVLLGMAAAICARAVPRPAAEPDPTVAVTRPVSVGARDAEPVVGSRP